MMMSAGPLRACRPAGPRTRAGIVESSSIVATVIAGVDEPVEHERHGGLQPDDAERREIELDDLLVGVMRRVVGGDHVDACRRRFLRASRRGRRPRAAAGSS